MFSAKKKQNSDQFFFFSFSCWDVIIFFYYICSILPSKFKSMIRLASIVVYMKVCHESPFSKEKEAFLLLTCRVFFKKKKKQIYLVFVRFLRHRRGFPSNVVRGKSDSMQLKISTNGLYNLNKKTACLAIVNLKKKGLPTG
jgi:hypothetical protein